MIDTSGNRYCGPFALAYLGGLPDTAAAARILWSVRWGSGGRGGYNRTGARRPIKGAYNHEMLTALRELDMTPIDRGSFTRKNRPTLARFLKGRRGGLYLINVTGHYIVVDGHHIYDSVRPAGTKRRDWPRRRKRVVAWWRFR